MNSAHPIVHKKQKERIFYDNLGNKAEVNFDSNGNAFANLIQMSTGSDKLYSNINGKIDNVVIELISRGFEEKTFSLPRSQEIMEDIYELISSAEGNKNNASVESKIKIINKIKSLENEVEKWEAVARHYASCVIEANTSLTSEIKIALKLGKKPLDSYEISNLIDIEPMAIGKELYNMLKIGMVISEDSSVDIDNHINPLAIKFLLKK